MKIYPTPDDFSRLPNAVVTSGTFDGVHVGHQRILSRLNEIAEKNKGESVVITLWPHPRFVLHPEDDSLKLLNTFEEKADLLRAQGVSHLLRIPFTKEFSLISSADFIRTMLVETIGTKKLVIGYDHHFGHNREGSFEELRKDGPRYGFDVEEIPRQDVDHVGVSSTRIRKALTDGDPETAAHFLGRPYSLTGRVVRGDKIGRLIGFPTANLELEYPYKLIPGEGIYAVRVDHNGGRYKGMLYIGNRPTLGGIKRVIEVNLFDFDRDIYGENLRIHFMAGLRKDSRFPDLDSLKQQLTRDKQAALEALKTES
jgi:riboflavin kinase/FMN adenylyltransferase